MPTVEEIMRVLSPGDVLIVRREDERLYCIANKEGRLVAFIFTPRWEEEVAK